MSIRLRRSFYIDNISIMFGFFSKEGKIINACIQISEDKNFNGKALDDCFFYPVNLVFEDKGFSVDYSIPAIPFLIKKRPELSGFYCYRDIEAFECVTSLFLENIVYIKFGGDEGMTFGVRELLWRAFRKQLSKNGCAKVKRMLAESDFPEHFVGGAHW